MGVRKNVTFLRKNVDMAIPMVRKDVTLLKEKAHDYIEGT